MKNSYACPFRASRETGKTMNEKAHFRKERKGKERKYGNRLDCGGGKCIHMYER